MATNATKKRKQQQRQAVLRLMILAAILVCVNILAAYLHTGLDLTKEKRFTLTKPTKKLLSSMNDVAVIDIYLEGKDLTAGYRRLHEAIREKMEDFRAIAGKHVLYRFIDPYEGKNDMEIKAMQQEFYEKGLEYAKLTSGSAKGGSIQYIYPGAVVHYNGKDLSVNLMEHHAGLDPLANLTYSESQLEYKFANAIHNLSLPDKPRIAYVTGNGELVDYHMYDFFTTIPRYYHLDTLDLPNTIVIPGAYKAIIIAKPLTELTPRELYTVDQYIMYGGNVLWAVDMLDAQMDSLRKTGQLITHDYNLRVSEFLFKYGARLNSDLIEDNLSVTMPIYEQGNMVSYKWVYFPVIIPMSTHPVVKNMGAIFTRFVGSVDTVGHDNQISKTVLLASSIHSRTATNPVRITGAMIANPPGVEQLKGPSQPIAVLLEGKFKSNFLNRLTDEGIKTLNGIYKPFKPATDSLGKQIVISDGDIFSNDFSVRENRPLEMGLWMATNEYFDNKTFLLNCLDYLTDNSGLLEARSKEMQLRLLDPQRVIDEKSTWQSVNIILPSALVLIFASAFIFFKKRRYEKTA